MILNIILAYLALSLVAGMLIGRALGILNLSTKKGLT
jgi:hypothetical protein